MKKAKKTAEKLVGRITKASINGISVESVIHGFDPASPDGDYSAEVKGKKLEDGTIEFQTVMTGDPETETENGLRVGDIVTRDGTDRHEVLSIGHGFDIMEVVCIKEPSMPWTKVGEKESNLPRRYTLIERRT